MTLLPPKILKDQADGRSCAEDIARGAKDIDEVFKKVNASPSKEGVAGAMVKKKRTERRSVTSRRTQREKTTKKF